MMTMKASLFVNSPSACIFTTDLLTLHLQLLFVVAFTAAGWLADYYRIIEQFSR